MAMITAEYEWRRFCSQQHPVAGDYLKLSIELHDHDDLPEFTESRPFICIQPQILLQECEDFLTRFLFLRRLRYLCRQVTESVMSAIQNRFQFACGSSAIFGEPHEFRLHLVIVVLDHDSSSIVVSVRDNTVENSPEIHGEFNGGARMVPTSGETIWRLLKKSEVTESKSNECCVICMEEFNVSASHGDGKEGYSIPCGHMFHHVCILTWLLTSHKCPVCRYSLPTTEGN